MLIGNNDNYFFNTSCLRGKEREGTRTEQHEKEPQPTCKITYNTNLNPY